MKLGQGVEQLIEKDYREMMKDEETPRLILSDLFEAVEQTSEVKQVVEGLLQKNQPLTIVLEGSATPENIGSVHDLISSRDNPDDRILLFDISPRAAEEHKKYVEKTYFERDYRVAQGDMMSLGLPSGCADLVVNDCAINYCESDQENRRTLEEIRRVLKDTDSACLFSAVVDRLYDDPEFGRDQELVGEEERRIPGTFPILPEEGSPTRKCWSASYYEDLFKQAGFSFKKFDVDKGRNNRMFRVSYRRYLLQKN